MTHIVDFANQAVGDYSLRSAAADTATRTGGGVDLQLSDGPVHAVCAVGATDFASGDETYVFKLQESDTSGGTYSDISGATVSWTAVASDVQNTVKLITTKLRAKRWVRAVVTIGGTTPSAFTSAYVFGQKKVLGGSGTQL
jgi:hypothetical protein